MVITHKDRLLRLGAELVFSICEAKQVEVVIVNKGEDTTFEEDLATDVLEIITVFSARLYGSRSRKNKKLLDGVKKAEEESQVSSATKSVSPPTESKPLTLRKPQARRGLPTTGHWQNGKANTPHGRTITASPNLTRCCYAAS